MRWERATVVLRLMALILGIGGLGVAAHLTRIGALGIEDVPPPFILLSGHAGIGFLFIAVTGRYPRVARPRPKGVAWLSAWGRGDLCNDFIRNHRQLAHPTLFAPDVARGVPHEPELIAAQRGVPSSGLRPPSSPSSGCGSHGESDAGEKGTSVTPVSGGGTTSALTKSPWTALTPGH
jgi:hypothetical protein